MTEMIIDTGIVIDDAESVIRSIESLCDRKISDFDAIKRFVNKEKNIKFYFDKALNSFMQPEQECTYVWLDTGFIDRNGNPSINM